MLSQVFEGDILILEPRRLAARLLAGWVADQEQTKLGGRVGYQVRFDRRISKDTRIQFVTEGVLLRRLLEDPQLDGVSCVVFDEFHERNLFGDISLARLLHLQSASRPDLSIGVMSATLSTEELGGRFGDFEFFEAEGRLYPVDTRYVTGALADPQVPIWERIRSALKAHLKAGAHPSGDILVFLPGMYEIRRTLDTLMRDRTFKEYECLPLYGELSPAQQDRAVSSETGSRRIIVSTNVAETSITISGVTLVVDSGLAKIERYDSRRGINTLLIEATSQASADQRAGRAGRIRAGTCIRMWREKEHGFRSQYLSPEILRVDLSEMLLTLVAGGIPDPRSLPWVTSPPKDAYERAIRELVDLGAMEPDGTRLTSLGQRLSAFPLHPRFSRMLVYGDRNRCLPTMALFAAMVQGRSLLQPLKQKRDDARREEELKLEAVGASDFFVLLRAWEWAKGQNYALGSCREMGIHAGAARQAEQVAHQFMEIAQRIGLNLESSPVDESVLRKGILLAFPDSVGRRFDKATRRCALVHGRRGELSPRSRVDQTEYLVAADLEEVNRKGGVSLQLNLVTAIEPEWLEELFPQAITTSADVTYDSRAKEVVAHERHRYLDLILSERPGDPGQIQAQAAELLTNEILEGNLPIKAWDESVERWIRRVNVVAARLPDAGFSPIDEEARKFLILAFCDGARAYRELKSRELWPVLKTWIPSGMEAWMNQVAPETLELPNRRRPFKLHYAETGEVILRATIQDLFDVPGQSLVILDGTYPLRLELLAPNRRPVQILDATGLDAFWETSYPEIRKELKGRYPKHEWR